MDTNSDHQHVYLDRLESLCRCYFFSILNELVKTDVTFEQNIVGPIAASHSWISRNYAFAVLVDPQWWNSHKDQCPLLSENTSLLDCSTHPRGSCYDKNWCVWVCVELRRPYPRQPASAYLAKHPFSIYTRKKVELWVLFKIIKGVALPLCPVWARDVETRKMKRKIVFFTLKKFCRVNVLSSPQFVALYHHGSRADHPPKSKTWLCYFWTSFNSTSLVWVKTSGDLRVLAYGIVY